MRRRRRYWSLMAARSSAENVWVRHFLDLLLWGAFGGVVGMLLWRGFPFAVQRHLDGETRFGRLTNRSAAALRRARVRWMARRR